MTTPRSDVASLGAQLTAIRTALMRPAAAINDLRATRLGLFQDRGDDRYLWLGLPEYAPAGAGISLGSYTDSGGISRTLQALPIPGVLQFIPPGYTSETREFNITGADHDGVPVRGLLQVSLKPRDGALRIAWHEDFAEHGGPYGLRAWAETPALSLPMVEWQRIPTEDNSRAGRVIRAFNAFAEVRETEAYDGIVVDVVLHLESRVWTPTLPIDRDSPPPLTMLGEVALISGPGFRAPDRGGD